MIKEIQPNKFTISENTVVALGDKTRLRCVVCAAGRYAGKPVLLSEGPDPEGEFLYMPQIEPVLVSHEELIVGMRNRIGAKDSDGNDFAYCSLFDGEKLLEVVQKYGMRLASRGFGGYSAELHARLANQNQVQAG